MVGVVSATVLKTTKQEGLTVASSIGNYLISGLSVMGNGLQNKKQNLYLVL
jgi:hypothetical protein